MDSFEKRIEDLVFSAIDAGEEASSGNLSNANHVLNSEKESVIKDIATLRADLAAVTAERDRMREALKWLPYPKHKPDKLGLYLVTSTKEYYPVKTDVWDGHVWTLCGVIAFAKLPLPYSTLESEDPND